MVAAEDERPLLCAHAFAFASPAVMFQPIAGHELFPVFYLESFSCRRTVLRTMPQRREFVGPKQYACSANGATTWGVTRRRAAMFRRRSRNATTHGELLPAEL